MNSTPRCGSAGRSESNFCNKLKLTHLLLDLAATDSTREKRSVPDPQPRGEGYFPEV